MRARLLVPVFCIAALATTGAQNAQTPAPTPPVFRGEVNYVRVDMYATERGQPVEDLTLADVELLEDGAPQPITAFEHVRVRGSGSQAARIEPNTVAESRQLATDGRARVFVIFLDTYHTQLEGSAQMRGPLVRFIDRLLGPDDLVAVMTPEMSARDITLARKTTVISNIMQDQWTWGRRDRLTSDDPKDRLYDQCYPDIRDTAGIATEMKSRRRERLTLDALDDLVLHLRGLREERKAVITVTEGWLLSGPNQQLARVTDPGRGQPLPDPFGLGQRSQSDRTPSSGVTMTECEADRMALANSDNRNRLRDLSEQANRANVTFYPVYARGLAANDAPMGPERPLSPAQDRANLATRHDTLRQLAIETDGLYVIGSNDIDRGMQRILDDVSSYYLLGYYSTNTRLDGRFRNITVRVRRPGVQVRARRGYRAPTAEELTRDAVTTTDMPSAVTSAFNVVAGVSPRSRFRLRAAIWPRAVADGIAGEVWVVGELDYTLRREVGWTAGAVAEVTLVSATGAQLLSTMLDVDEPTGRVTMRITSPTLAPGEYALRVRVRANQDGVLPVAETARLIVAPAAAGLGEAVLWRRGPSTGPRYLMTADPRFQRSDRLRLEQATVAAGTPTARLLDRQGRPIAVPVTVGERPDDSAEFRWLTADVALAPLTVGSYAIEVTLGETKSVTAFTVVP